MKPGTRTLLLTLTLVLLLAAAWLGVRFWTRPPDAQRWMDQAFRQMAAADPEWVARARPAFSEEIKGYRNELSDISGEGQGQREQLYATLYA
ncbi:MAG: hypothetical protein EAZ89_07010, partial [Bacteroidetes bacterium]